MTKKRNYRLLFNYLKEAKDRLLFNYIKGAKEGKIVRTKYTVDEYGDRGSSYLPAIIKHKQGYDVVCAVLHKPTGKMYLNVWATNVRKRTFADTIMERKIKTYL